MMDKIFIKGLNVETIIGICEWEKKVPQVLVVDIEMACDIKKAAKSESLDDSIDYADVAINVEQFIQKDAALLLEPLAERLADFILQNYATSRVRLSIAKPQAVSNAESVGVEIVRTVSED